MSRLSSFAAQFEDALRDLVVAAVAEAQRPLVTEIQRLRAFLEPSPTDGQVAEDAGGQDSFGRCRASARSYLLNVQAARAQLQDMHGRPRAGHHPGRGPADTARDRVARCAHSERHGDGDADSHSPHQKEQHPREPRR